MVEPEEQCIEDVIAISQKDYLRYGCPHCGHLPPDSLSDSWQLLNEEGDVGECINCNRPFIVLKDGQEFSPFVIEIKGSRSVHRHLQPHPRKGIPHNNDISTPINLDVLPIGKADTPLLQAQTAA
ncbi:MAG: hypothetical protein WC536_03165 [Patescibacteria group bacterium]